MRGSGGFLTGFFGGILESSVLEDVLGFSEA